MPFRETYVAAFKNDIEYSQLVLQTAAVLQSNKFMQVRKISVVEKNLMKTKGLKSACAGIYLLDCFLFLFLSLFLPERTNWTD